MKKFLSKIDVASVVIGMTSLALVEMVVPKVASSIVKVGNDIAKKVGIK